MFDKKHYIYVNANYVIKYARIFKYDAQLGMMNGCY